jgi:flagellar motor switch protein FliN/FliY
MSDAVVYEQLDESDPPAPPAQAAAGGLAGAGARNGSDLRRLAEVPMELSVEIGRTHMTVGETLGLRPGSIVTLERLAGEPVDLLVNGTPLARGEVVVVDEQFGLRVTEILDGAASTGAHASEDGIGSGPVSAGQAGRGISQETGRSPVGHEAGGGAPSTPAPAQDPPAPPAQE